MDEWDAECIVVGLPLETSGKEGRMASEVRDFGDGLERRAREAAEEETRGIKRVVPKVPVGGGRRRRRTE